MRAVIFDTYGGPDVLRTIDMPIPAPRKGEVLVRIASASVNPIDDKLRRGKFAFLSRWFLPKVVGHDFSGTVEAVGGGVSGLAPGDLVFGAVGTITAGGSCAEFVSVAADKVAHKPAALTHAEAAALPVAGSAALAALAGLRAGRSVMIVGASGGVGTFAVQIARRSGLRVVAVAGASRHPRLLALGADRVLDYADRAFTAVDERFDRVVDLSARYSFADVRHLLHPGGRFLAASPGPNSLRDAISARLAGYRAGTLVGRTDPAVLAELRRLVDDGLRPVIGEALPFDRVVDAHRRIASGQTEGKIVIDVAAMAGA